MAALDRYTIDTLGLDGRVLMSNAAREVLRETCARHPGLRRPLIVAGTGNNGGDGIALAYYAQQAGLEPLLTLCHPQIMHPPSVSPDAQYFLNICEHAGVPVKLLDQPASLAHLIYEAGSDLLVDALFGTGLDRPLGEYYVALIERMNHAGLPIVAVDCPSGLNCSTGLALGAVVSAGMTVTMGYPKLGYFHPGALEYLGELVVAQLGFGNLHEAGIQPAAHSWPDAYWDQLRQPRKLNTHKGDFGRLLIVAGHRRYSGAPRLAAQAALATGAGLVRLVVPGPIYSVCTSDPAVMVSGHACDGQGGFDAEPSAELLEFMEWADALVLGPGMSDAPGARQLAQALLNRRDLPAVVDADGLRALWPEETPDLMRDYSPDACEWPLVLTPHVGELGHLAGASPDAPREHWFSLMREEAERNEALVLAKSCQCAIAIPGGGLLLPGRGNPALASGGTGDVLAGILGALLARYRVHAGREGMLPASRIAMRRMQAAEIAATAVNIHARAAACGVRELGENGLTATALCGYLPLAMRELAG